MLVAGTPLPVALLASVCVNSMSIDEEKLANNMSMAVSPCLSDASIEALYDELDVETNPHLARVSAECKDLLMLMLQKCTE